MAMTTEKLEEMFRQADFSAGTGFKDELRNRLFSAKPRAKILPMFGALSDDALEQVAAAGTPNIGEGIQRKPDGEESDKLPAKSRIKRL